MKSISYITISLAVLVGAASCTKSIEKTDIQSSGELRQVTITAGSEQTKTSVSGGALTWSENDKLNIVPQSVSVAAAALDIKSGVGTASGKFEGTIDPSITDETALYGWCGGSWTYNSGAFSVNMPAEQTYVANGLAENAYPSIGTGSIKSGITLSNPMGVLKLSIKGATANDKVKSITVTSVANNLAGEFTVNPASSYAVSGGSSKTLTFSIASPVALSLTDAVNFYIVVPPAKYAANDLTAKITFSDDTYLNYYITDAVTVSAGSATAKEISDHTGRRGTLNTQEWVMIKGSDGKYLNWATQNLAVTTSGKAKWSGTNYVIGDYFQWAASYDGYGITTKSMKVATNLVIYDSFKTTCKGDTEDKFTLMTGKSFLKEVCASYCNGTNYTKYTIAPATLALTDDVANIVLGSTWRMPTGGSTGEIKAMRAVTYWALDATHKGYYVFKPGVGTSGSANAIGTIGTGDDKTKALLFFPAAGVGYSSDFLYAGNTGYYWSSTLYSGSAEDAHFLHFKLEGGVTTEGHNERRYGFSVRPVTNIAE